MEYTVRYKGHDISIVVDDKAGLVSTATYRIDDWSPCTFESVLKVSWFEMRDDALTLAKAKIERILD